MNNRLLNLTILLCIACVPFFGNAQTLDIENYTVKEGLAQSNVNDILQDSDGYIWLATDGGLSRFDGYSFHNYSSKDHLAETKITSLIQLPSGEIWMGHTNGYITIYNKGVFKPFLADSILISKYIYSIYSDKSGAVWICTLGAGAIKIIPGSKSPKPEIYSSMEGLSEIVYTMFQTRGGKIYSITEPGIKVFDEAKNKFSFFKPQGFPLYRYTSIAEDTLGNLWLGTQLNGIISYQSGSGIINNYTGKDGLSSDFISCIYSDSKGSIWFGTWGGGICKRQGNRFRIIDDKSGLGGNKIRCIKEDREKNLWTGLHDAGVSYYKGERFTSFSVNDGLANNNVNAIIQDTKGRLWFGNNSGISVYAPGNNKDNRFINLLTEGNIPGNQVMALKVAEGKIIVGTYNGEIFYINSENLKPGNRFKVNSYINTLEFDKYGALWIGTADGIFIYDERGKSLEKKIEPGLTGKNIACLFRDSKNKMWIAMREGGLVMYNGMTYKKYSDTDGLTHNSPVSVCEDKYGNIWLGSEGGGMFNYDGDVFTHFSTNDGLISDYVTLLVPADEFLWIGTNLGVSRLQIKQNKFISYSRQDGFKAVETRSNAGYRDHEGNLWFGTVNGIARYSPVADHPNAIEPCIHITDFEISAVKQKLVQHAELNHKQNDIRINFITLSYQAVHKNRYQYILEGFDNDWKITQQNFVAYPNLLPNEYTFKVKASNGDGIWNSVPQTFSFTITPPFIKTWWFRVPAILFIMAIIYFYNRTRLNAIRAEKQRELAEQAKYYEEQFLANMSHEIRTPLNAAIGMTNLLLRKNPRPDQLDYLNAMKQSSQNLLVILNDILDLSKIQAGKIELEEIPFSINEILTNVYNTLRFKAEEKSLLLITKSDDAITQQVIGDPVRLTQIIINLTGNAIKFTNKGSVTVSCLLIEKNSDTMQIEFNVTDTGIGIPEDKISHIFDSFSQATADTTRKYGGTGLGLSISKNLIELMGGKISVQSKLNEGATFSFMVTYKFSTESKAGSREEIERAKSAVQLSGIKVLLAEDNPFNQMVVVDTLKELVKEVEVEVVANGQEAIDIIQRKSFDVILMDIQMPVMDGITAIRHIRSQLSEPLRSIKIIALSAGATKNEIEKCYEAGADDYIAKPFEPSDLISKLSQQILVIKA